MSQNQGNVSLVSASMLLREASLAPAPLRVGRVPRNRARGDYHCEEDAVFISSRRP
jgi:hypothetical protein